MAHHHDEHVPVSESTNGNPGNLGDTPRELAPSDRWQKHGMVAGTEHEHGPDRHAGHGVEMFRTRFWLSLVLTVPTVGFGHMIPSALGREPPHFRARG